ncbi:MAG: hypothetical protein ABH865_07465 [Candidatus Omnitrophota bacterium]
MFNFLKKNKKIRIHTDITAINPSGKDTVENTKIEYCCSRFKEAVQNDEICFSYSNTNKIDETAWAIDKLWHIYYCPFCGKFIKGEGFGDFDKINNK